MIVATSVGPLGTVTLEWPIKNVVVTKSSVYVLTTTEQQFTYRRNQPVRIRARQSIPEAEEATTL